MENVLSRVMGHSGEVSKANGCNSNIHGGDTSRPTKEDLQTIITPDATSETPQPHMQP